MNKLVCRPGVSFDGLAPAGQWIRAACDRRAEALQHDLEATCTTGDPQLHGPTDPHTRGNAIDVRTNNLAEGQIYASFFALMKDLGAQFTVLYEVKVKPTGILSQICWQNDHATGPHFHIQLLKGLTTWTPPDGWTYPAEATR